MLNTLLEEAIDAWQDARSGVIHEVENLPDDRFDFRPTPQNRSVTELVIHIMEVSLMMTGELTRDDTNLRRYPWPELIAHYSKPIDGLVRKKELLPALRSTIADGVNEFRRAGEVHMLQQISRFDGQKATRLQWMYHGIAQEEYHRGQLAIYARLIGVTPALTKLIQGGS